VHAYDFAFAKGSDFDFVLIAAGLVDHALEGDGRAGGCILFCSVVALEDLSGVAVMQGCGGGSRDVEKQIYADRKVCGVHQAGAVGFNQTLDAIYFSVPSGGADDHILAGFGAGFDMVDDAVGRGEIDNYINLAKLFRGEGSALFVFCGSGGMDVVAALAGGFRHQRSCLSTA